MSPKRRSKGEGSVFKRKDGMWVARVKLEPTGGKRRQRTVYAKTQPAAVAKLREAKKAVDAGDQTTAPPRLEKWLDQWIANVASDVKPTTARTYRTYVEQYIKPTLGHVRLDRLNTEHVRQLHRAVEQERSGTTALHAHRVLSNALQAAVRENRLQKNVARLVKAPTKEANESRTLSIAEVHALFKQLDGDRLESRWHFALAMGARQGECLGLRWTHVNLQDGLVDLAWQLQRIPYRHGCKDDCGQAPASRCPDRRLDVPRGFEYQQLDGNLCLQRPKTKGSTRLLPLPEFLHASLRRRWDLYLSERQGWEVDHGLVWSRIDGRPIDNRVDYKQWLVYLEAAGIPATKLHSARHTTSSVLGHLGVPEDVRMSILGHSEAATNRLYTHIDLTKQREAMRQIGSALTAQAATDES